MKRQQRWAVCGLLLLTGLSACGTDSAADSAVRRIRLTDVQRGMGVTNTQETGLDLHKLTETSRPVFLSKAAPGYKVESVTADHCTYEELPVQGYGLGENDRVFRITSLPRDCNVTVHYKAIPLPEPEARGNLEVLVVDALTQAPVSGLAFELCTTAAGCQAVTTQYQDGLYTFSALEGDYDIKISGQTYRTAIMHGRNVTRNQTTVLEQHLMIGEAVTGDGTVKGRLIDAVNGAAVAGARLEIRPDLYNRTGQVLSSVTLDETGTYSLDLPTGYYTVTATRDTYTPLSFNIYVLGNQIIDLGDKAFSPALNGEGEWRVVLSWSATPNDLDLHVTGPKEGSGRYHVYFGDKTYQDNATDVNLDRDDVDKYGPETLTFKKTASGLLRFYIHNFSGESRISTSGAKVSLYQGNFLMREFNVPNGTGKYWNVFTLDMTNPSNPVINPVNTITTSPATR